MTYEFDGRAFWIENEQQRLNAGYTVKNLPVNHGYIVKIERKKQSRTNPQNNALHLYFDMLGDVLNESGQDKKIVFSKMKEGVFIEWDKESVKNDLFKPIMKAVTGKTSTAKLTKDEISKLYEVLNRFTAERLGVSVGFPSEEL